MADSTSRVAKVCCSLARLDRGDSSGSVGSAETLKIHSAARKQIVDATLEVA